MAVRSSFLRNLLPAFLFLMPLCVVAQTDSRPNIIFILADDLGWADLSCYGSSFYETPTLDKMAAAGIRFTNNYSSSPVCSPTRGSFMTGKNPARTGITDWITGRQDGGKAKPWEKFIAPPTAFQLAPDQTSIAQYARSQGYSTFFAGKWHLGEDPQYWPEKLGFEINKGGWSKGSPSPKQNDSTGGFFSPYNNPRLSDGPAGEYLTDRLTNECIRYIDSNTHRPFFMVYSLYAVHNPLQAPAALIRKYQAKQSAMGIKPGNRFATDENWMKNETGWKRRLIQDNPVYAAMIENMDWNIGRLMEKLKQSGIADNTLIIFTSDNGGLSTAEGSPTVNGPLRAGKGWLYEGGIRVPLILYWNKLKGGEVKSVPVITSDFYPTLAKLMNPSFQQSDEQEGVSLFDLLRDTAKSNKRTLYWYYPHYSNQGGKPSAAIRKGHYKLIYNYEGEATELYDLRHDLGESQNLAGTKKRLANKLKAALFSWLKANTLSPLTLNPAFNGSSSLK
jgi:arylsulfatase A-like enzyme